MRLCGRCSRSLTKSVGAFSFLISGVTGCVQTAGTNYVPFGRGEFPASVGRAGRGVNAVTVTPVSSVRNAVADGAVISNDGAIGIAGVLAVEYPSCGATSSAGVLRAQVLTLVNQERQTRGLQPLWRNSTLEAQAEAYACEMIHYDFFGHDNPINGSNLRTRNAEFGYPFRLIGENLAAGQQTARDVMKDWMNSRAHRENLLNPNFREVGIGIRLGGDYGTYWVQEFGQPPGPESARALRYRFARG